MIKLNILLAVLLFPAPALTDTKGEFTAGAGESFSAVRSVYDGDSFNLAFRLNDIDTPEIKGKCESEKRLAIKARDFSRRFFKQSKELRIVTSGTGKYGRPLVDVYSKKGHLNSMLVEKGLAVKWAGRKHNWCS